MLRALRSIARWKGCSQNHAQGTRRILRHESLRALRMIVRWVDCSQNHAQWARRIGRHAALLARIARWLILSAKLFVDGLRGSSRIQILYNVDRGEGAKRILAF